MRILPRNLFGQMALVMAIALLAASLVNFLLLVSERSRAAMIEATGPAMARFVDLTHDIYANPPSQRAAAFGRGGTRFSIAERNMIDERDLPRNSKLEGRLRNAFNQSGDAPVDIRAAITPAVRPDRPRMPPAGGTSRLESTRPSPAGGEIRRGNEVVMSAQLPDGRWVNAAFFSPEPPRGEVVRLAGYTFILFAAVLGASLWFAARLSRPLKDMAAAAARVGSDAEPGEVQLQGPSDVQQTLEAFNAMTRRVSQLLKEKDVMLGALGHDLRTPLASLRIRVESMEPASERQKAIRTIEEAAQLLDDILELARRGRSAEPVQMIDLAVLVEDMVEDYTETGAAVELAVKQRTPAACRPVLFRRLLRNLIDNALTYAGSASLSIQPDGDRAVVTIDDNGPGMTSDALANVTRPFVRGDDSRSRRTGGAGLGLAIADAVARTHGGELRLENRPGGGLRASVFIPLADQPKASAR